MKIAILTAGTLPVPAVRGGAVENLIDFYLDYNDRHKLHDITVYSISHPKINQHPATRSTSNHYYFIEVFSLFSKIAKNIFRLTNKDGFYDYAEEFFLKEACKHIRKQDYDIIIIENRPAFALKLRKNTNARLVYHLENDYLSPDIRDCRIIYDAAYRIINTSEYITRCVKAINPDDTKCRTVLNGINTEIFYQAHPISRETLGIGRNDFVIVYSGRLTEDKGILQLIQAIRSLDTIPNLKLLIIGASKYGKDGSANTYIQSLEREAAPIKDQVIFTGFLNYKQIPSYLKACDIAVVPSMWEEAFGLTVVEAMAAGLPLITTNSGGIPEICKDVAIIVERQHIVDQLAKAIADLYDHPDRRKQMSSASLDQSRKFTKEEFARNYFAALE